MKSAIFFKSYLLMVFFSGVCHFLSGQTFNPEIENYSIEKYRADNQNWGVDVDHDGVVFIANNKGLLRYNGQSWQLYELPNKTIIRSVLCVGDKIYTGSYEEFGFWVKNDLRDYVYTSLKPLFDVNHELKSEEFWQIIEYNGDIIFKSFGGLYVYDGEKILHVDYSEGVTDVNVYKNKIIVGNLTNGLQEFVKGKLIPFTFPDDKRNFKAINNLAALDEQLFFFDVNEGGFVYDTKKLSPLPKEVNSLLNNYIINRVAFLDGDTIVFGTIKNGILVYNLKTKSIQSVNKEAGLQNNTVLGLKFNNGNVWAALDNGIGKIDFENPYLYYHDLTGTLGTVYDVAYFNEAYYLASNTGIYTFVSNSNELQFITGSEGHVWDLSIINNQLICGHNKGSYRIEKNALKPIDLVSGGVYGYEKIPLKEHWYLQGTYSGISLLKNKGKEWETKTIANISFPVNKIVFESDFIIWATHPYKGVCRIILDETYTQALNISYYGSNKHFKQYKTNVFKIDGTVAFYNSDQWFQYFKDQDSIGAFKDFQKFNHKAFISKEKAGGWFIDRNDTKTLLYVNNDLEEIIQINAPEIKKRLISDYEKIIVKNDSMRIMNLNDGIAIFNLNKLKNKNNIVYKTPVVDRIYSRRKQFSVVDSIIRIPYNDAKYLTFEIYTPNMYENNHSYTLSGKIEQKEVFKNGKLTLQNLPYGSYTLSLKNEGFGKKNALIKNIHFKVLPPWYASNLLKALYVLLMLSVIFVIFKINKIKIRKQQLALRKEYIRETEKRISGLEKKNLEKEIRNKRQELISSTSSIIKKNEVIMVLTNELKRLSNVSPNQFRTQKAIDTTKEHIKSNNDWKIFESNFNALNEDFIKQLIAAYPKLTTKDLKLCAYIKTGLSSKEIAPLMGISLRGVELHRYRLRKKINIDSSDNLINFLRGF